MCDMNNVPLPIPNPTEWMTIAAVAFLLGVSRRSVERYAAKGVITAYRPYGGPREKTAVMFWRPEIEQVVNARTITGAGKVA